MCKKPITLILLAFLFVALFSTLPYSFLPSISEVQATSIFSDGFETNDFSAWTGNTTTTGESVATTTAWKYQGSYGANFSTDGSDVTENAYVYKEIAPQSSIFARGYLNLSVCLPEGSHVIFFNFRNGTDQSMMVGIKNASATLYWYLWYFDGDTQTEITNATPTVNLHDLWWLEAHWKYGDGTGEVGYYVNGSLVCGATGKNTTRNGYTDRVDFGLQQWGGAITGATKLYGDCVVIADSYTGEAGAESVIVTITDPEREYYNSSSISVSFSASGGTIDEKWYNCKNSTTWIYGSNVSYTTPTSMTGFTNGENYSFYAFANNTVGTEGYTMVKFKIDLAGYKALGGTIDLAQSAIDEAYGNGGGNVYLPAGNFSINFNSSRVDPVWGQQMGLRGYNNVNVTGGIGAEYPLSTILRVNTSTLQIWGLKSTIMHYYITDFTQFFRVCGIYFQGWCHSNLESGYQIAGFGVVNGEFRLDHCNFTDFDANSVGARRYTITTRGLFDHLDIRNYYKDLNGSTIWGYGIQVNQYAELNPWLNNSDNYWGNFRDGTFICEDSYFYACRYAMTSNEGAYFVFRHNIVDDIPRPFFGAGIDVHEGDYYSEGGRGAEVYNNTFNAVGDFGGDSGYAKLRAGTSLIFNNTGTGYDYAFSLLRFEWTIPDQYWKNRPFNNWAWDNDFSGLGTSTYIFQNPSGWAEPILENDPSEGIFHNNTNYADYSSYQTYTYPHPWQESGGATGDTAPTWEIRGSNATLHGASCLLYAKWSDDISPSHGITEHNNTGTFSNTTIALSGNPAWCNHTLTLNATIGVVVAWRMYANDSLDQWSVFSWQYITIKSEPRYGSVSHSNVIRGISTTFICAWVSSYTLRYGILSHNNSGSWQNRSAKALSGLSDSLSDSFTLINDIGVVVGYRFYANDSQDLWNGTGIYSLTTIAESTGSTGGVGFTGDLLRRFIVFVDNKPMKGVTVRIYESAYDTYVCSATTETDGSIDVNLPTGEYHYIASYEGATVEGDFFHIETETTKIKFGSDGGRLPLTVDAKLLFVMVVLFAVVCGAGFGIMKASKMR